MTDARFDAGCGLVLILIAVICVAVIGAAAVAP